MSEIIRPGMNVIKRTVPGHGPTDAKIVLVGEAPGETEDREGIPFVGVSGQLLTQQMQLAKLNRQECYLTNVIKERPAKNNIKLFVDIESKTPKLSEAYLAYRQELKEELLQINPNLIIAVGNVALYALTGQRGINKWRGSILESNLLPGVKVLPIIHPAAALREYILRHYILFDLKKAVRAAKTCGVPPDARSYILRPTFEEAATYLNSLRDRESFAFDIEVKWGQLDCISFAPTKDEAISIPLLEGRDEYFPLPQERAIIRLIAEVLESPLSEKIGHNTTFDATFLLSRYGIKARNLHDTMVAQALLFPDFPKSLAFVTSVYTDVAYYKDEGKEAMFQGGGSDSTFWLYNAKDSIVLMEAFPKMMKDLERQGNLETYNHQRALIPPLLFIGTKGVSIDKPGLRKAADEAKTELDEIREKVNEIVGYELNPASPKQLLKFFYEENNIQPYLHLGKPTTNEKAIVRLSVHKNKKVSSVASLLLRFRKLDKLRGTYYEMEVDADSRVRCSMNPVGTKTGRLSSSKTIFGTGANMQNQPKGMKKYMHPDPGYVFYEVDMSQAENRAVAYISGDEFMMKAFEEGRDIHRQTAGLIFNKPYMEVSEEEGSAPLAGGYSERFWGKRGNHGLNYGMRENKASLLWEVPNADAKLVVEKYHAAYPGVRRWHRKIEQQLRANRTLTNLFGRRYTVWDRMDDPGTLLAAYAYIPQSTIADAINRWGVRALYEDQDIFRHAELLLQVHDSILFQIPIRVGAEVHARVLLALKERLEQPLYVRDEAGETLRSFTIPAEFTLKPHNYASGFEFAKVNELGGKYWPGEYNDVGILALKIEEKLDELLTEEVTV